MNILFRVDAGDNVGLGHFYRSLNLAIHLNKRSHNVIFSYKASSFWEKTINSGFPFQTFKWEEYNHENFIIDFIESNGINVFYVDCIIDFDEKFINRIKKKTKVIFYQNLSDSRWMADIFILPSIHVKKSFFKSFSEATRIYKGLEFLILNEIMSSLKPKEKIEEKVKHIGIVTGGSDPNNTLKKIYEIIDIQHYKEIKFTFYYGNDYAFKELLPKNTPVNTTFSDFNHKKIIENDLLISAFGVSTYEFLLMGLPIITYGHKKSNADAALIFSAKTKALVSIGEVYKLTKKDFTEVIDDLIYNKEKRVELVNRARKILDLEGVNRVVKIIEKIY